MLKLIQDFVYRRSSSSSSSINTKENIKKAAAFSSTVEIHLYEHPDESNAELYCTRDDYRAFKRATRRAVRKVHRRYLTLLSSSSDSQGKDDDLDCLLTGLENILTLNIIEKSTQRTKEVRQAVLDEQERQKKSGYYDPEMLAFVSRCHSAWAVKRAIRIGSFQSEVSPQSRKNPDRDHRKLEMLFSTPSISSDS